MSVSVCGLNTYDSAQEVDIKLQCICTLRDKITVCSSTHFRSLEVSGGRDLYLHRNVYDFTFGIFIKFVALINRYCTVLRSNYVNTVLKYCTTILAKDLVNTKY